MGALPRKDSSQFHKICDNAKQRWVFISVVVAVTDLLSVPTAPVCQCYSAFVVG